MIVPLRKLYFKIINPTSDIELLCMFFVVPILTIVVSLFCYQLLHNRCPKFLSIISGGRL